MNTTASKIIGGSIALVQVFDIIIHAITDQLEFLRVTSNIIILIWLVLLFRRQAGEDARFTSFGVIGFYLLLNLFFLFQEGFTNPEQGNAPRTMLFILVTLTSILSLILASKSQDTP